MPDGSIQTRLASARKDLLDLSSRNRLISTPRGAGRSSRLEVVDELSDEVFRRLITEQKAMSFASVKEDPNGDKVANEQLATELLFAQPSDDESSSSPADRHIDDRLQTALSSEALQKSLLKLYYDARTYEEEQGVNILYLALGFLKWFEDDRSTKERFAPLVLVPVTLTRRSATARFKITWTQDDIITNLSLQEKLRHEFSLQLPDLPAVDDINPSEYFTEVSNAIASLPRWQVLRDDMVLWFFSFSKFLMYRDLDSKVWPEDRPLDNNRLVTSLLGQGFRNEPPICGGEDNIDQILTPADTIHVVDADSSQALAIEEVRRGTNLVIQGPPGTGKSQTIANLIATAVKDGKRILFVAEKMAALEVVKRRLDNIDLGDMCLELHSHKANKRSVLEELKRTKSLCDRAPKLDGVEGQAKKLCECRDRLNRHAEALHTPIGRTSVTAYRAVGALVRLNAAGTMTPRFQVVGCTDWTIEDYERKEGLVREVANHIDRLGNPSIHPWRGVLAKGILPSDVANLTAKLPPIRQAIQRLRDAAQILAQQLAVPTPATAWEIAELAKIAQQILTAPPMDRTSLANDVWDNSRHDIDNLLTQGPELDVIRTKLEGVVSDAAWGASVAWIRRDIKAYGRSIFRIFNKQYRDASAGLAGLLVDNPPKSLTDRVGLLDDLMRVQKAKQTVVDSDNIGRLAFGKQWRGADSDWKALAAFCRWEQEGCRSQQNPQNFRRMAAAAQDLEVLATAVTQASRNLKPLLQALQAATAPLQLDLRLMFGVTGFQAVPLIKIEACIDGWAKQPEALLAWIAYKARVEKLKSEGLGELAKILDLGELAAADALGQFALVFHENVLREAYRTFPDLATFDGLSHAQVLLQFQTLDRQRLQMTRQEVAYAHHQRIPDGSGDAGELGIVNREINKKRNHLPIRRLLSEAGHAVQAIKPVFMMSPISVAQYLQPGVLGFDLLLIDEASQVQPVDALGAIARADQITVVGDDRQLPPTQFFAKMLGDDGGSEDEDDAQTSNIESILGLCRAQGMRDRMLRWHYRSRHHSLIAVSNHEFYEDQLYVIPSPERKSEELGLRFHPVQNGVFDRGKSATNRIEAVEVAEAVIDHARRFPAKSLGVGAFSVAQRDAILDELELRRRQHPELENFFVTDAPEPFFVKNLENIQGDERDVIYISVGYGRDASGYMGMNFGPVSNDGGERRLNVLFTRAKERCEVFSSITSDDIDLNRGRAWGAKALKAFLRYAQLGELDVAVRTERDFDSEFEREVASALANLGYEIHPQVGLAGFFIDLAIVDPESPGRYLLGIECDGASYHSSRSARDRDRLRQQVLEDRGWMIHRIWSTDWLNQPQEQLRQALAAIEDAKIGWATRKAVTTTPSAASTANGKTIDIERHDASAAPTDHQAATPYAESCFTVDSTRAIYELSAKELASVVIQIVKVEGPIHQDEIARRVASLWGCKRTGARINEAVESALHEAAYFEKVEQSGPFFKPKEQLTTPVRDRSNVRAPTLLKPEYLPPDEIRAAVFELVRAHFGMTPDEAVTEVTRLLGFRRTGPQLRQILADEIQLMVSGQLLLYRSGKLYCVTADSGEQQESLSAS